MNGNKLYVLFFFNQEKPKNNFQFFINLTFWVHFLQFYSYDVLMGEAYAALLVIQLAATLGHVDIILKRDYLLMILAINSSTSFSSWCFCNIISDTSVFLSSFKI